MALEIVDTYITCEIAVASDVPQVTPDDAGKDFGVTLDGNDANSMHPKVKVCDTDGDPIFGKLVSVTVKKNQCRVAIRGANMIYAGKADYADADVGKGILASDTKGQIKPGGAVGSRDADEVGAIVGGTSKNIRVDMR